MVEPKTAEYQLVTKESLLIALLGFSIDQEQQRLVRTSHQLGPRPLRAPNLSTLNAIERTATSTLHLVLS